MGELEGSGGQEDEFAGGVRGCEVDGGCGEVADCGEEE